MLFLISAVAAFAAVAAAEPANPFAPWGTHLAYGNDPTTSMSVMWSTRQTPAAAAVVDATLVATGETTRFAATSVVYSDSNNTQTIHTAFMTGLAAGGHYTYVVGDGSAGNSSATFSFALHPVDGGAWGAGRSHPVLTIYGDMGVAVNSHKTLPLLYADARSGAMDVVLHVGDIAYDLQSANGASGDAFVTEVEPFAANMPVHYCPVRCVAPRRRLSWQFTLIALAARRPSHPCPFPPLTLRATTRTTPTSANTAHASTSCPAAPRFASTTRASIHSTWASCTSSCSRARPSSTSDLTRC